MYIPCTVGRVRKKYWVIIVWAIDTNQIQPMCGYVTLNNNIFIILVTNNISNLKWYRFMYEYEHSSSIITVWSTQNLTWLFCNLLISAALKCIFCKKITWDWEVA